jgi:hypothetical protein
MDTHSGGATGGSPAAAFRAQLRARGRAEKNALLAAWNRSEARARTLVVPTHVGDIELSIRVPCEREPTEYNPPYDVLAALFELGHDGDEIDAEERQPLENELVRRFAKIQDHRRQHPLAKCTKEKIAGLLSVFDRELAMRTGKRFSTSVATASTS